MSGLVLSLDIAGTPHQWIDVEAAAYYYAKNLVAWTAGEHSFLLHGGTNAKTGRRSILEVASIVAIRGADFFSRNYDSVLPVSKDLLLARDHNLCAYCGQQFRAQ